MSWQKIFRSNFRKWEELADFLELSADQRAQIFPCRSFPLNLPRRLAAKVEKGNINDPILRQFLPLAEESLEKVGFSCDPCQETAVRPKPRLLQKYAGRALLIPTSACAMHCRYCFRRHFDYAQDSGLQEELELLRFDSSISEVILSGGDPLSLPNHKLQLVIDAIDAIAHVKRIRFHTRFPIGIPERIDEGFLQLLPRRAQTIFVIHCNHPLELDEDVLDALQRIERRGIPVLNQTVLAAGVNDTVATLQTLCERLIDHGILPYYLHQLDRVAGTAHFEVPIARGLELIQELAARLPGYGVPQYVTEVPKAPAKVPTSALPSAAPKETAPVS